MTEKTINEVIKDIQKTREVIKELAAKLGEAALTGEYKWTIKYCYTLLDNAESPLKQEFNTLINNRIIQED